MNCSIACVIGIVMLVANVYFTIATDKSSIKENFYKTLNDKEINIYKNIIAERKNIYFKGMFLGLVLSGIVMVFKKKTNSLYNACLAGAITFITEYFFYILHPKSDYMINHLHKEKQRKEWLNIYRTMQVNYHIGLVVGIVGVMIFYYGVC